MHFMAHRRLFCVFRHSFTLPNEPWPRSLITTYWFRYALPLASERSDTVLVLREFLLVDTPPRGAPSRRSRARVARRGGER